MQKRGGVYFYPEGNLPKSCDAILVRCVRGIKFLRRSHCAESLTGGNGDPISTAATNDGRHVARCLFDSQRTVTNRREAKNHPAAAAASGRNVG